MITLGKLNTLKVNKIFDQQIELTDEQDNTISLNKSDLVFDVKLEDEIEVFIFTNKDNELVATTDIPYAQVGELAYLKVIKTTAFGAFLDWGVSAKDLLLPSNLQKKNLNVGDYVLVRINLDYDNNKLFASAKVASQQKLSLSNLNVGDKVEINPFERSELGFRVIVNNQYLGMIYNNETFREVELGETIPAVIKKIREDGLLDISLQSLGMTNLRDSTFIILDKLKSCNGKLPLHDKSTPEEIKAELSMSKQSFKRAIGILFKEKKIKLNKDSIELLNRG